NHELVVGVSDVQPQSDVMHGFFAVDGKLIDIGTPPGMTNSYLGAVNDVGVAVGGVGPDPRVGWRGIVATRERLVELSGLVDNTSATIGMASDIDEAGNIVAPPPTAPSCWCRSADRSARPPPLARRSRTRENRFEGRA